MKKMNEVDKVMLGLKIACVAGIIGLVAIWYHTTKIVGDVPWIK